MSPVLLLRLAAVRCDPTHDSLVALNESLQARDDMEGALLALRFALLPVAERKHVTWGCGYTAPNTRMQYTGSSFSAPMIDVFRDFLRFFKRGELPQGVFPKDGSYETHCMDSVERLMFGLLNGGDSLATKLLPLLSEDSRFSFALGLVGLIAIGVFVAMS